MLWYKSWLETRYRLLVNLIITALMVSLQYYTVQKIPPTANHQPIAIGLKAFVVLWSLTTFTMMGGAGIATQTLIATKGLHGSMQYTLALPVSRLRMVLVRAGLGWLEAVGCVSTLCWIMWLLYPVIRETCTPLEMVEYVGTLIACGSSVYFLSVLLGTLVNDQLRALGSIFLIFVLWWGSILGKIPASINVFDAMGKGPSFTHTIPWSPINFSLGLSVVLLFAALQVVRRREY